MIERQLQIGIVSTKDRRLSFLFFFLFRFYFAFSQWHMYTVTIHCVIGTCVCIRGKLTNLHRRFAANPDVD